MNRRGFLAALFGGAAVAALAPNDTAPAAPTINRGYPEAIIPLPSGKIPVVYGRGGVVKNPVIAII